MDTKFSASRCSAFDRLERLDGEALIAMRCRAEVDVSVSSVHCRQHAHDLACRVRGYKQVQAEIDRVTGGEPKSWAALAAYIGDTATSSPGGRTPTLRRLARLLLLMAKKRMLAECTAHYGDPGRLLSGQAADVPVATLEALKPPALRGVQWPDPAAPPDPCHVEAIVRYVRLHGSASVALEAVSEGISVVREEPEAPEDETDAAADADDDPWAIGPTTVPRGDDKGNGNGGMQPRRGKQARRPGAAVMRSWTSLERFMYETYWRWAEMLAGVHPLRSVQGKQPESDELMRLVVSIGDMSDRHDDGLLGVLRDMESLGVAGSALFAQDPFCRLILSAATRSRMYGIKFLAAQERADAGTKLVNHGDPVVAAIAVCCADLRKRVYNHLVLHHQYAAAPRGNFAGAWASAACTAAVLSHVAGLSILERGCLAKVFLESADLGAMALVAACVGLCGPEDALLWWAKYADDEAGTMTALRRATDVAFRVAMKKAQTQTMAAVLDKVDHARNLMAGIDEDGVATIPTIGIFTRERIQREGIPEGAVFFGANNLCPCVKCAGAARSSS